MDSPLLLLTHPFLTHPALCLLLSLSLSACAAHAPSPKAPAPAAIDESDLAGRVTRRAKPFVAVNENAGIAIGVAIGERTFFFGFGRATDATSSPPNGDTLLHLATNGSGLPMMPTNWVRVDEGPYTPAMFDAFLGGYALPWAPGTRTLYSNVGFGLLGMALGARTGLSFGELIETRVLDPLGMTSTAILGRRRATTSVAQGHDDEFQPVPDRSDQPRLPACCALESTTNDLMRMVHVGLRPASASLGEAVLQSQRARVAAVGELEDQKLALGWFVDLATNIVWKGGQMKGYRSTLALDRALDAGVVVLANGVRVRVRGPTIDVR